MFVTYRERQPTSELRVAAITGASYSCRKHRRLDFDAGGVEVVPCTDRTRATLRQRVCATGKNSLAAYLVCWRAGRPFACRLIRRYERGSHVPQMHALFTSVWGLCTPLLHSETVTEQVALHTYSHPHARVDARYVSRRRAKKASRVSSRSKYVRALHSSSAWRSVRVPDGRWPVGHRRRPYRPHGPVIIPDYPLAFAR